MQGTSSRADMQLSQIKEGTMDDSSSPRELKKPEPAHPTDERSVLETNMQNATIQLDRAIIIGAPILLLVVFIELAFANEIYRTYLQRFFSQVTMESVISDALHVEMGVAIPIALSIRVGSLVLFTIAAAASVYFIRYRIPFKRAKEALQMYDDKLLQERIRTHDGWKRYLQEELRRLTHLISRVFLDNPKYSDQAKKWLKQADKIVEDKEGDLVEAQAIISSINKLISTEQDELKEQKNWRIFAVTIMICYIFILAIMFIITNFVAPSQEISFFGIPSLIVVWGALGSLAAILYRFYTTEERIRLDKEVRWLIARPIIGIIMAAMAYLTLSSGLILLSAQADQGSNRQEVFWIVAFLAGFSDKFYIGIIDLLVYNVVGDKTENQPASDAK